MLKVPVDEFEVATLEAALGFAAEHGATLGAAARAYVEREHALDRVADAYAEALESAAGGDAVDDAVLWRIAEAAAEVGIDDAPRARARRRRRRDRRVSAVRARLSAVRPGVWLTAIVVGSIVLRMLLAGRTSSPWIMVDELIYSELAQVVRRDRPVSRCAASRRRATASSTRC